MKKRLLSMLLVICMVVSLLPVMSLAAFAAVAEEDAALTLPVVPTNAAPTVKFFTTLPLCRRVERGASVCPPGGQWKEAEEGRFYPFGTAFRAEKDGILVVAFGLLLVSFFFTFRRDRIGG